MYGSFHLQSAPKSTKISKDSIIDDHTKYQTSLYASKVNRPSFYRREKKRKKWEHQNIARMLAGIPFAVLYGAALYLMLRFIFIDHPRENSAPKMENMTVENVNKDDAMVDDQSNNQFQLRDIHIGWGENRPELIYASVGFTSVVGTLSVFSRGTRCSMLLMLPCLITGRSRAVLFAFITGMSQNLVLVSNETLFDLYLLSYYKYWFRKVDIIGS